MNQSFRSQVGTERRLLSLFENEAEKINQKPEDPDGSTKETANDPKGKLDKPEGVEKKKEDPDGFANTEVDGRLHQAKEATDGFSKQKRGTDAKLDTTKMKLALEERDADKERHAEDIDTANKITSDLTLGASSDMKPTDRGVAAQSEAQLTEKNQVSSDEQTTDAAERNKNEAQKENQVDAESVEKKN